MAVVTIPSDFGAPTIKSATMSTFSPSVCHEVIRTGCYDLSFFFMLSFKPDFSLPSFTLIKRLFSSFFLCSIRMVSSVYLRLLIFLLEILIPACDLSSLAFCIRYSVYKLNKQGDIQSCCTPLPILNQSIVPCPVLTVASWPAYRFLMRQVRWSGIPISFRIFHNLLWSTQSKVLA